MFCTSDIAKRKKLEEKAQFITKGGKKQYKIALVDGEVDYNVDGVKFFGSHLRVINPDIRIFPRFPKTRGIPNHDSKRLTMLIAGPSGSGKSSLMLDMMQLYNRENPKNNIYLFTTMTRDPRYAKINNLIVVDINDDEAMNEHLLNPETCLDATQDYLGVSNMNNILVAIDDIELGMTKDLKQIMDNFIKTIMYYARHNATSFLWCRHRISGREQVIIDSLSELQYICVFRYETPKRLRNLLENYLGLDKRYIPMITKEDSRYTIFSLRAPMHIIQERFLTLPN
jgi:archaellum biogenesis ATPase FlaH